MQQSVSVYSCMPFNIDLLRFVGMQDFLVENAQLLSIDTRQIVEEDVNAVCNKDTGGKKANLQKWSRGLHHFVRGGGIIDKFDALFV